MVYKSFTKLYEQKTLFIYLFDKHKSEWVLLVALFYSSKISVENYAGAPTSLFYQSVRAQILCGVLTADPPSRI